MKNCNCSPYAVVALLQGSSWTSRVDYVTLFLTLTAYYGSFWMDNYEK